jgi:hypothetical protein
MVYDEIIPYLNKIVRLNLKNKKRKIGWLVVDTYHQVSENPLLEVHCVNVRFGKKLNLRESVDMKVIANYAEVIQLDDIRNINTPRL